MTIKKIKKIEKEEIIKPNIILNKINETIDKTNYLIEIFNNQKN